MNPNRLWLFFDVRSQRVPRAQPLLTRLVVCPPRVPAVSAAYKDAAQVAHDVRRRRAPPERLRARRTRLHARQVACPGAQDYMSRLRLPLADALRAQVIDANDAPLAVRKMRPSKGRTRHLCVRLVAAGDEQYVPPAVSLLVCSIVLSKWCLPEALTKLLKEDVEAFIDDVRCLRPGRRAPMLSAMQDIRTADTVYTAYKAVFDALNWVAPTLPGAKAQNATQDAETQDSQRDELQSEQNTQPPLPIHPTSPLLLRSSLAPPLSVVHPGVRLVEEAPEPATRDGPLDNDVEDDQSHLPVSPSTIVSLNGSPKRAGLAGAVGEGETEDTGPSGLRYARRRPSDAVNDHDEEVQFISVSSGFDASTSAETVVKVEDDEGAYMIPPGDRLTPGLPLGELDHDVPAEESEVDTPSDIRDIGPTAARKSAKDGEVEAEGNGSLPPCPFGIMLTNCLSQMARPTGRQILYANGSSPSRRSSTGMRPTMRYRVFLSRMRRYMLISPICRSSFPRRTTSSPSSRTASSPPRSSSSVPPVLRQLALTHTPSYRQMSSIHVLLKRLWVDGDRLLGDFANSYALRTRAMKLSKALTSRGLLVNDWKIVTLDDVEVDVRSSPASQDGKQSPFAQHVTQVRTSEFTSTLDFRR
jgi:hypothetical protein